MSVRLPVTLRSTWVRLALLMVAILGFGAFVIIARARLTNHPPGQVSAPAQDSAAFTAQSKSRVIRIPSHVITLRPGGFDPAEVSWPKGRFFLTVDNRSNINELTLRLDREVGGRVKETTLRMRKERSAGVFDLTPGTYLLTEADHPGWVCRIRITPQ